MAGQGEPGTAANRNKPFGGSFRHNGSQAWIRVRTARYRGGERLPNAKLLGGMRHSGAAAESILLALAIAKTGNEHDILTKYKARSGRLDVQRIITGNLSDSMKSQFSAALNVLHYWRDEASHGTYTSISEIEAYASLTQLLRLDQFAVTNLDVLTR
jgi:hypothetical protein